MPFVNVIKAVLHVKECRKNRLKSNSVMAVVFIFAVG